MTATVTIKGWHSNYSALQRCLDLIVDQLQCDLSLELNGINPVSLWLGCRPSALLSRWRIRGNFAHHLDGPGPKTQFVSSEEYLNTFYSRDGGEKYKNQRVLHPAITKGSSHDFRGKIECVQTWGWGTTRNDRRDTRWKWEWTRLMSISSVKRESFTLSKKTVVALSDFCGFSSSGKENRTDRRIGAASAVVWMLQKFSVANSHRWEPNRTFSFHSVYILNFTYGHELLAMTGGLRIRVSGQELAGERMVWGDIIRHRICLLVIDIPQVSLSEPKCWGRSNRYRFPPENSISGLLREQLLDRK